MSITVTFYRLPASERQRVTRDQSAWEAFRAEIQAAHFGAFQKAMAGLDGFTGTPEERFARLDALVSEQRDPRRFDLEKDWQTIGYLLTGRADIVEQHDARDLLYSAIFGGRETTATTGYGPVRFYDTQLVSDTASALRHADRQVVAQRFDPVRLSELDIYAAPDESERDGVLAVLDDFSTFFVTAASSGEEIIKFST
jgi:hypothetical protein